MSKVYIEPCPKGQIEGSLITGYVVEDEADRILYETDTQAKAIQWTKTMGYMPLVAWVRHLNNKSKLGHWRAA